MRSLSTLLLRFALAFALAFGLGFSAVHAASTVDPGQVCISVGKLMEQGHYSRQKLDDDVSKKLLQMYLETLDYSRLFFTQADIDAMQEKYGNDLDDDLLLGTPDPAIAIFDLYQKRVEERVAKIQDLIAHEKFTFDSDRAVLLNRQKAAWPKDDAEADQLWHDRIEGELLQEKLSLATKAEKKPAKKSEPAKAQPAETAIQAPAQTSGSATTTGSNAHPVRDTPEKIVAHRYEQLLRDLHEQTHQDAVDLFLKALALTYDPHSEYMSKTETDNFNINMRLSLFGIGAVLHSEDGYAKIMELVTGGPAQKDGRLKVGDRITAVAQGDGEFVDAIDMKLDKVVQMIRGAKDTKVRLQVIPAHAVDPSARKIVEIIRDQVALKDSAAKADLIEKTDSKGHAQRLGWITLPSFYADMEHPESKNAKSTTRDVLALLTRLKQEGISGLVIDLRRNGGGSLDEAIRLTNLFVKQGPVVQVKDARGNIQVLRDRNPDVAYDGPLIVLINSLSASASEIFAAALQDYGRAVIVGDTHSFGKGTVQMLLDVSQAGHVLSFGGESAQGEAGSLKLTIQKFYRIAGGSTQLHGVASDVRLPSLYDHEDIGEGALKGPLPYDEVAPADFQKEKRPLFFEELRQRSAARVAADPEFKYVLEDLEKLKQKVAENRLSLNEKVRRDEIAKEKARREARIAEREKRHVADPKIYALTLDNVSKPTLELAKNESKNDTKKSGTASGGDDKSASVAAGNDGDGEADDDAELPEKEAKIDPIRQETLHILADLIDLSHGGNGAAKHPKAVAAKP